MDRFSLRDNVLLVGYNQRCSFSTASSSSSPKAPFRNSDDDFRDVFGGPPRRFSMQDPRHSFGHSNSTVALGFSGGDETISSSRPWSEKPVFGEEGGGDPRRYTSDDFFDDIFRGGDSESSTPRKIDKDLYSSSPGSRVLSPARPLPARAEPFGGSSQLAQFSLPAKLNKGTELSTFASANHSPSNKNKDNAPNGINHPCSLSASMSRFSSQAIQVQDESRNDARPSYRQSPLSVEFSLKSDGSVQVNKSETDTIGKTKKDSNCSDVPTNSNQFHFSIYKWASKGVPLLMPLRSGKGSNLKEKYIQRCSSSRGRVEGDKLPTETLFDMELPSSNESALLNTEACRIECVKQDTESLHNSGTQDKMESSQSVTKAVLVVPELKSLDSLQHTVKDSPDKTVLLNKVEELKPHPLSETGIYGQKEEKTEFVEEGHKPELKPLHSLLSENDDGQGDVEVSRLAAGKEIITRRLSGSFTVGRNIKTDGKRTVYNGTEVDRSSFQGSPVHMGDNLDRNKIKGKVKDFVKIFNKEAPLKPINNAGIQSPSYRWKEATFKAEKEACVGKDRADETLKEATFKAEKEVCAGKDRADETLRVPTADKTKISPNISVMVEEYSKESQEPDSGIDTASHIFSSTEQKDSSFSSDGSKTTTQSVDDFFQGGFCNFFMMKELSQDQNKVPQAGEDQQDFQDSDAKIKQWSAGKEGNIRSLLSTLQYILWPDSGWRPVPLADIIEGNAVKRAYQKALLCLHPDKLQQKGAAAHQKYAAEKVFEILQEAWDHFNSLGSL